MCRAVKCKTCGKTTWAGCGQHVAQVKAGVPNDQWCGGHGEKGSAAGVNPFVVTGLVLAVLATAWLFLAGRDSGDDGAARAEASELSVSVVPVHLTTTLIDDGATVIDVRTPAEFDAGHLGEAVNIDFQGDFETGIADLDKYDSYVLYCLSGNRAGQAVQVMADAGFSRVVNAGGYDDLVVAGLT